MAVEVDWCSCGKEHRWLAVVVEDKVSVLGKRCLGEKVAKEKMSARNRFLEFFV